MRSEGINHLDFVCVLKYWEQRNWGLGGIRITFLIVCTDISYDSYVSRKYTTRPQLYVYKTCTRQVIDMNTGDCCVISA
jgi:hypothetical protein